MTHHIETPSDPVKEAESRRFRRIQHRIMEGCDVHTMNDVGAAGLTCREAEAIVDSLRLLDLTELAKALYEAHARSDDEDDSHAFVNWQQYNIAQPEEEI